MYLCNSKEPLLKELTRIKWHKTLERRHTVDTPWAHKIQALLKTTVLDFRCTGFKIYVQSQMTYSGAHVFPDNVRQSRHTSASFLLSAPWYSAPPSCSHYRALWASPHTSQALIPVPLYTRASFIYCYFIFTCWFFSSMVVFHYTGNLSVYLILFYLHLT